MADNENLQLFENTPIRTAWDEDNEEREWIEEKNDYEDLEQFLRTKIKLLIHKISSLKI